MASVSQHQTNTFASPVRSAVPVNANVVRGNDNILRVALNAHDSDETIHVQSSDFGDRPAAGVEGRIWATPNGASDFDIWYDDGTSWRGLPAGGGGGGATNLTYTASTRLLESSTGTDATLPLVSSTDAGLAPASGGGTTNFLRADGTWAEPPGTGGGGGGGSSYLPSGW